MVEIHEIFTGGESAAGDHSGRLTSNQSRFVSSTDKNVSTRYDKWRAFVRCRVRRVVKWKPSNIGWRFYQFIDNMLYWMAWPFFIVSWFAFFCRCLIDFGVGFSPVLVHVASMCLKFSAFSCSAFLFAIFFQLTVPFVFWRGFVDYHVMIAKYRRDDRGMFEMATSLKFLILTLFPCVVLRGLFFLVPNVLSMTMSNVTTTSFYQVAAILLIKVGFCATLGVGMFVLASYVFSKLRQLDCKHPHVIIGIYNERQLSNVISSGALSKGKAGDTNECDLDARQSQLYDTSDDVRTLYVLSSVITSLFSVVSRDPPTPCGKCISLSQVHSLEKELSS